MVRFAALVLAFGLAAVAAPLAAPTAAAYCVHSVCAPVCMLCPWVLSQAVNSSCTLVADADSTDASCTLPALGTTGESTGPLPGDVTCSVTLGVRYASDCALP